VDGLAYIAFQLVNTHLPPKSWRCKGRAKKGS